MANTYTLISSATVGSGGAAFIEFTSIPATYTDLCLLLSGRVDRAVLASTIVMTFNGITTLSYSDRTLLGSGASGSSSTSSGADIRDMILPAANATANTFGNLLIYVPNYAGSNNKSVSIDSVMENNATTSYQNLTAGLLANTSAITSIKFTEPNGGSNFVQYSTAYLYGIKNS